jgi:hypothetical protein
MSEQILAGICELIQQDIGNRGLRADPKDNLITRTAGDFQAACRSMAATPSLDVAVVTGFYIPAAQPPCGETDGPLGALYLARVLTQLNMRVVLMTDGFCGPALAAGLSACGLAEAVPLEILPSLEGSAGVSSGEYWMKVMRGSAVLQPCHLVALERVGPSHTESSIKAQGGSTTALTTEFRRLVPPGRQDRCFTMRGRDITANMSPAHLLFEAAPKAKPPGVTIGIGDGGNEIGMGKIPWDVIRRNIPNGELVACRVPTDQLIVCGVSNWGAYGLAVGTSVLRGQKLQPEFFDPEREREVLRIMVEKGPLVDGVTAQPTVSVDGLTFEQYVEPLVKIGNLTIT